MSEVKTKSALEAEVASLRAQLAEAQAPVLAPAEAPETEEVSFFNKKRKAIYRIPTRPNVQTFVQGPRGLATHTTRHPRPAIMFQPDGKFARGIYTTRDPEEIAFLDSISDPRNRKFKKDMLPKLTVRRSLAN